MLPFTPGLILYVFGICACRFVLEAYRAPLPQYMTTMSNEAIVAELGWTMQIIYDQNGGRVPKYWVSTGQFG
jgi:prolipoprotein diacylglyceryltransferase